MSALPFPSEPSPTSPTACPRCERVEVVDGHCPYCGPLPEARRPISLDDEWEELTVNRRRAEVQRARSMAGQAVQDRRAGRRGLLVGALVLLLVVGGALAWAGRGDLPQVPQAVAQRLPALELRSAGAAQLARLAREQHELAVESEQRLGKGKGGAKAAARLRADLKQLHQTARELEPALTRDESRILIVLAQAERALDGYQHSFETKSPDLAGAGVKAAEERIARAQAMLRGESLDPEPARKGAPKAGR